MKTLFSGIHGLLRYKTERVFTMKKKLLSCAFNMDTACVELRYSDGSMIAIDCDAVEDTIPMNLRQRTELNWPIYNAPLDYADLILNGDVKKYFRDTLS